MKDILIIVPTRSRPGNAERAYNSWLECTSGKSQLLIAIDGYDDVVNEGYRKLPFNAAAVGHTFWAGLSSTLNYWAQKFAYKYKVIGFVADDMVFRTPGWEEMLLDHVKVNTTAICYGNDLLRGEELPTSVFLTSNIIRALGYMAVPTLQHMYIDDVWRDMGKFLGCLKYFPDLIIEHIHHSNGAAVKDAQYERTEGLINQDYAAYLEYGKIILSEVQKIKDYTK